MTRLEIVSDLVCPWCFIGKVQLDQALAEAGNPFVIRWQPFQLNPDMPAEGMDHRAYYAAKFGEARAGALRERITEAGRQAGATIAFDRIRRAINSLDAHRLMRWAEAEGVQHALAGVLFERYFSEGKDLSDHGELADAAAAVGMEAAVVARLLEGDADREAVRAEAAAAAEMGITGVPTFLLGGRYAISGAQPVEMWVKLIGEIEAAGRETGEKR